MDRRSFLGALLGAALGHRYGAPVLAEPEAPASIGRGSTLYFDGVRIAGVRSISGPSIHGPLLDLTSPPPPDVGSLTGTFLPEPDWIGRQVVPTLGRWGDIHVEIDYDPRLPELLKGTEEPLSLDFGDQISCSLRAKVIDAELRAHPGLPATMCYTLAVSDVRFSVAA